MADGTPRNPIVAEQAADRLYIIDARHGVERRILLDWIHSTSGDDEPAWASLDIEDGDHALPVDVLQARLGGAASRQVVPLRVAWRIPGFDKGRALKFRHLIFGDPR
ncbi:MAG TPA: glycerol-3-phosphate acyltransferase, partial [Sphingopyxis sp.]|nr:glycerol-3-phosphate acyltransferase [Sphingopyxis sp.]